MQTHTKQKSAGLLAGIAAGARLQGITEREYLNLGRFSNDCDKLGLKTTGISRGMFGTGCRLQLSGKADYEVLISNGSVLLGKVEGDKRIRLAEGGSHIAAGWEKILGALKQSEGRLQ